MKVSSSCFIALFIVSGCVQILTCANAGAANLIRHVKFDGDFIESSLGNYPTKIIGKPVLREGVFGGAVQLDGRSALVYDDYSDLNVETFTLSAWVCPHSDKAWGNVAGKGDLIYWLFINNGEVKAGFHDGSQSHGGLSAIYLKQETWYFAAVTFDGEMIRVYIDGYLHWIYKTNTKPRSDKGSFIIGTVANRSEKYFLDASIDDVRLYDGALDSTQIFELYQTSKMNP